jgi:vitamin B12 transporter
MLQPKLVLKRCIDRKLIVNAVAFQREEEDAIGFDLMTYKYFNVNGKNKAKGLETMVSYVLNDKVKFNANYTFTELERQSRILNPKHKVNAAVDVQATLALLLMWHINLCLIDI